MMILLLRGIPRAGKSFLADYIKDLVNMSSGEVSVATVSSDDPEFNQLHQDRKTTGVMYRVNELVKDRTNLIIVNDPFLNLSGVNRLKGIATTNHYDFSSVVVENYRDEDRRNFPIVFGNPDMHDSQMSIRL